MARQQTRFAEQVDLHAAVGDGVEEMTAGAALGDDALQKFLAAQTGNFDTDRRILGLKSIGDQLAFIGAHGSVEGHPAFFFGEIDRLVIRRGHRIRRQRGEVNQQKNRHEFSEGGHDRVLNIGSNDFRDSLHDRL